MLYDLLLVVIPRRKKTASGRFDKYETAPHDPRLSRPSVAHDVALFDRPLSLSCRGTRGAFPLQLYKKVTKSR